MKYFTVLLGMICLSMAACKKQDQPTHPAPVHSRADISITQQDMQHALSLLDEKDQQFAQTSFGKQNLLQILLREKLSYRYLAYSFVLSGLRLTSKT